MHPDQSLSQTEVANRLSTFSLFSHYPEGDLLTLADATWPITAKRGTLLCPQAARCESLYLVNSGVVELRRVEHGLPRKVMRLLYAGDCFGEYALFSAQGAPVSATVVEDAELLTMDADAFVRYLSTRNSRLLEMLETLSREVAWWMAESHKQHGLSATRRVAAYLLERHEKQSDGRNNDVEDELLLGPRTEVASLLAIRPETLSRTLREFRESRLIRDGRRGIAVTNAEQLALLADDVDSTIR